MSENNTKPVTDECYRPRIRKLGRRAFMRYSLAAGGTLLGVGAGLPVWGLMKTDEGGNHPEGFRKLELTDRLSQNPAFRALALEDGGAVVWVRQKGGSILAYRLNVPARLVWELCDGSRSDREISLEYQSRAGHEAEQALDFIDRLKSRGLVVEGGYLLAAPAFPDAPEPRRYLHRL